MTQMWFNTRRLWNLAKEFSNTMRFLNCFLELMRAAEILNHLNFRIINFFYSTILPVSLCGCCSKSEVIIDFVNCFSDWLGFQWPKLTKVLRATNCFSCMQFRIWLLIALLNQEKNCNKASSFQRQNAECCSIRFSNQIAKRKTSIDSCMWSKRISAKTLFDSRKMINKREISRK